MQFGVGHRPSRGRADRYPHGDRARASVTTRGSRRHRHRGAVWCRAGCRCARCARTRSTGWAGCASRPSAHPRERAPMPLRQCRLSHSAPPPTTSRPRARAAQAIPAESTTCRRCSRRRRGMCHQRSSSGHGPAHEVTGRAAPPTLGAKPAGGALSRILSSTCTGVPEASSTVTACREGNTVPGVGSGSAPGQGRFTGRGLTSRSPTDAGTSFGEGATPVRWAVSTASCRAGSARARGRGARAHGRGPPQPWFVVGERVDALGTIVTRVMAGAAPARDHCRHAHRACASRHSLPARAVDDLARAEGRVARALAFVAVLVAEPDPDHHGDEQACDKRLDEIVGDLPHGEGGLRRRGRGGGSSSRVRVEVGRGSTGPQRSGIGGAHGAVPVGSRGAEAVTHGLGGQGGGVAGVHTPSRPRSVARSGSPAS